MEKSEGIKEIALALSLAQAEFEPVKKSAKNPFFKSKYATLDSVISATKDVLKKNGLAVSQIPDGDFLVTILIHKSGEWISGATKLYLDKQTAQGQGSAITYARRYALSSILGITSEEDDDGHKASQRPENVQSSVPQNNPPQNVDQAERDRRSIAFIDKVVAGAEQPINWDTVVSTIKMQNWHNQKDLDYIKKLKNTPKEAHEDDLPF